MSDVSSTTPAGDATADRRQQPATTEKLETPLTPAPQQPMQPKAEVAAAAGAPIIKPANDDMEYRHLVLPNGLRVLLVSDPTADKAGAAMDVCVGSLCDPDSLPGLAHFTEHMLFYSSEKYPVEDEYTKFISDRGGSTNAYTSAEHTNYHFDINWESLEGALDRFAQFFIAPTISADGIEREVLAVDSEHGKNLSSDAWRKSQVNKATANPTHPWARFSTGNRDTLFDAPRAAGTDPRSAVLSFHASHYSADRGALAVLGRQGLDELEGMVRSLFSAVPNKQLPRPTFPGDVFLPEQMRTLLRVVPVREGQSLELVWQVPPAQPLYRQQPLGYLSHLLGHEGEGSVFAALKSRGWASALWAGESGGGLSFVSFFTVHVELTEEGQRHIEEVGATVFRYISLLRRPGGISERIFEEVRGLAQLHFDTRDRSRAISYATSLASGLQSYPPQDLLPALYGVPREFGPEAISSALHLLTPARVRVFWISKAHAAANAANAAGSGGSGGGVGGGGAAPAAAAAAAGGHPAPPPAGPDAVPASDGSGKGAAAAAAVAAEGGGGSGLLTEPVYGTQYGVDPLPAEWLAAWEAANPDDEPGLHLPAPNPFIPTDLSLSAAAAEPGAAEAAHPAVALAVPGRLRLWHKPDTRFGQPKAVLYVDVQSPEAYASPRAAVMTRMFVKLMLDYMNEVAYPAQQAGLDYNLLNTQTGWQLLLSGYNHKLPLLLAEVLERLAGFKVLPDRFEFVREGLVREYANQLHNQPYSWAMYRAELLTTQRRWPIELYGSLAADVRQEELAEFVRRLNGRVFVEALAAGNLSRPEALRCGSLLLGCCRDRLGAQPLHPAEHPMPRVIKLPPTQDHSRHTHHHKEETAPPPAVVAPAGAVEAAAAGEAAGPVSELKSPTLPVPPPALAAGEEAAAAAAAMAEAEKAVAAGVAGVEEEADESSGVYGGGWLYAEDGPSATDENSAAVVVYQRGPDDLRANALASLLVHLSKRDAFFALRTQQQLGYIVSLHGGAEHGVGYTELLVQSNAYDADELCARMDEFVAALLETDLPAKCGLGPVPVPVSAAAAPVATGEEGAPAPPPPPPPPVRTEFETGVEELAKSKLEKPKKLADLTQRWWSEVHHGTYVFDRQESEVAALRSLTPPDLMAFAGALLAPGPHRRKLSVQIRGRAEAARAELRKQQQQQQEGAGAATGVGAEAAAAADAAGAPTASLADAAPCAAPSARRRRLPYSVIPPSDPYGWKAGCEAWPAVRAVWAGRRRGRGRQGAAGVEAAGAHEDPLLPGSVGEEEAEEVIRATAREREREAERGVEAGAKA